MADMSDSEGEMEGGVAGSDLTYSQEQAELKASFKQAVKLEEEEGALLVPRKKTKKEKVFYRPFLLGVCQEYASSAYQ